MKRQLKQHNRISASEQARPRVSGLSIALRGGFGWASFTAQPGTSSAICPTPMFGNVGNGNEWLQGATGRANERVNYRHDSLDNLDL